MTRAEHRDAYVSRILVNAHRDSHRSGWRRERPTETLPEAPVADLPDPMAGVDTTDALRRAVAALSQGQREVVALRYYLHLTEPQIAASLKIAPGTVKSRLSRALAVLAADAGLTELREGRPE